MKKQLLKRKFASANKNGTPKFSLIAQYSRIDEVGSNSSKGYFENNLSARYH